MTLCLLDVMAAAILSHCIATVLCCCTILFSCSSQRLSIVLDFLELVHSPHDQFSHTVIALEIRSLSEVKHARQLWQDA